MQYRHLGRSGLKVSAISLGSWTTYGGTSQDDLAYACMTRALELGINFFDNAEAYGNGNSEICMGKIFERWFSQGLCKRSDIVVSTKLFRGMGVAGVGGNPNSMGCSRKHLLEGVDASLQRLQLSYVDLLFCHRPDLSTPIEETVRAMNDIINQGKAFYWGTSEWSAADIAQAHAVAAQYNLIGPLMEQPQYNLLHRTRFEQEYAPLYAQYGTGTTVWSPLASGLLTGKYAPGVVPEGSRLSQPANAFLLKAFQENSGLAGLEIKDSVEVFAKIDKLKPIAEKLGCSLAVLSLAWCLANKNVSTIITGASRPEQIEENVKAVDVIAKLTPEVLAEIDDVIGTKPKTPFDWGRGTTRKF